MMRSFRKAVRLALSALICALLLLACAALTSCAVKCDEKGMTWQAWTIDENAGYSHKGKISRVSSDGAESQTLSLEASSGLDYSIDDEGRYYVAGIGKCRDEVIYISSKTPDGKELYGVANAAFEGCSGIRHVVFEDGISYFDDCVFIACPDLISVSFPATANNTGTYTFYDCQSLVCVLLPDKLETIGQSCFYNCRSLLSVNIPGALSSVGAAAFTNCSSLPPPILSDGIENIGVSAFSGCSAFDEIRLPASLSSLSAGVFSSCTSLVRVVIPASCTSIGSGAFASCVSLKKLFIPASVTDMDVDYDDGPFTECLALVLYCEGASAPEGWNDGWDNVSYYKGDSGYESTKLAVRFGCTAADAK